MGIVSMFQSCKIVVLSVAFFTSIFCAGGNVLFAVIPEESYFWLPGKKKKHEEEKRIKDIWLSILDDDIENNEKFKEYREYKDLIATQSDGDFNRVEKFVRLFVSSLYKNLSDSYWWKTNVRNHMPPYSNGHFLYCDKDHVADLCPYIDHDVKILTDFLLKQMFPSDKSIQMGASYLKEAIRHAFAEKKISLEGLSALFSSLWIKEAIKSSKYFSILKIFIEEGGFFCGKFADAFQELFIGKDWCFRGRLILFNFFGGYAPSSNIEVAYGLQAFRIIEKRKEFQTFSEKELSELSRRITRILEKRNIILHTILMTVPPENVKKVEKAEKSFYLMTEKMEDVRDDADLFVEQRFSDSQYWKIEPNISEKEGRTILDELGEREKESEEKPKRKFE